MRCGEMKMRFLFAVLGLLLLLGCGATTATPDGDGADGLKIYDVRNTESANHPAVGTSVTVNNVVVISNVFSAASNLKGVFLSDVGGGEYAAILLTWKPTSADATYGYDPPALTAGMVINVVGNYNEFCGTKAPYYTHCSQQIELTPYQKNKGSVVDTGSTSALPIARIVDPAAVKTDGTDSAKWQNALIAVDGVAVTGAADSYKVFTITGDLKVDDTIYKYAAPEVGTEYDRIMGFLYTSYDAVALLPRSADDMVPKGQLDGDLDDINIPDGDGESADTADGDTNEYESPEGEQYEVDFDHEGLMIVDLQNTASPKHPAVNSSVTLNGVVAISDVFTAATKLKGVMISDIGGGPWAAILLTWKPTSASAQYGYDPPVFTKGQVLNVVGNFNAFCGTSTTNPYKHCSIQVELTPYQKDKGSVTVTEDTADVPAAQVVNPALIRTDGAESAVWQSSLVEVDNVFVETAPNSYGIFTVDAGLEIDDQLFAYDKTQITVGKNYEKIVGYLFTSYDTVHIVPRSAEDMVVGTQVLDGDTTDNDTTPADGDVTDNDTTPADGDVTDNDTTDNDTTVSELSIKQIQNTAAAGHPAIGTRVTLKNVIVTSAVFNAASNLKAVFLSDAGGGAYSGVMMTWKPVASAATYGYDPPALSEGSIITVVGNYNEFCGTTTPYYTHCSTQIELTPYQKDKGVVTVTGTGGALPPAQVVDGAAVKNDGVDSEKWQGSLIELDNVTTSSAADQYGVFTLTSGLSVDDQIYKYTIASITAGTQFTKLVGFLATSYDLNKLWPRAAGDMVLATVVDGDTTDNDTTDNDTVIVDGDTTDNDTTDNDTTDNDTTDNDTVDNDTTDNDTTPAATEATILQLNDKSNAGHPAIGTRVLIKNAVVTSVTFDSASNIKGAFISEQISGAYRGIIVTWRPTATTNNPAYTPPAFSVGSIVDVEGNYTEFCGTSTTNPYTHCTTQIELSPYQKAVGAMTVTGNGGTVPLAQVVLPAAIKTDGADVAQWQGSLVEVDNVTVLTAPTTGTYGIFTVTDGLEIDDQFYKYDYASITVGKSYSKIVGFLFVSYNTVHIIPRSLDDLVEGPVVVDGDTDNDTTDNDTTDNDTVDGDTDTTEADSDGTTEPPAPTVATIYQIQNPIDTVLDPNPDGSSTSPFVQLNNVVVTSDPIVISASSNLMGVFVSEQGGGEYSGLVVIWKTTTYTTAPTLVKGDVVTVVGTYTEYGTTVRMTEIEITPTSGTVGSITKNSQSVMPPAAHLATPADISTTGSARDAWQGSLVRVENVTVASLDGTKGFLVDGGLTIGNLFYTFTQPVVGDGYTSIQGFLYTASNTFKVMPLAATDLVKAPVVEDGDADTTDNDTTDNDTTDNDTTTSSLLINEIIYDDAGTDGEFLFVEIKGTPGFDFGGTASKYYLYGFAQTGTTAAKKIQLTGVIPASGYYVLSIDSITNTGITYVPDASIAAVANQKDNNIDFTNTSYNLLLVNVPDFAAAPNTFTTLDTIAWRNNTTANSFSEGGILPTMSTTSVVTGGSAADPLIMNKVSYCRVPDGTDTNDNAVDFKVCTTITPGAANIAPARR